MESSGYVDKENIAERLERLHDKIDGLKVTFRTSTQPDLLALFLRC